MTTQKTPPPSADDIDARAQLAAARQAHDAASTPRLTWYEAVSCGLVYGLGFGLVGQFPHHGALHLAGLVAGLALMLGAGVLYMAYRRRRGLHGFGPQVAYLPIIHVGAAVTVAITAIKATSTGAIAYPIAGALMAVLYTLGLTQPIPGRRR